VRADLLDRVQLTCPPCTWDRGAPASLRLDRSDGGREEIREGSLRCVRCRESYPVLQGVAVLVPEGHRRVAQEAAALEDPVRHLAPHLLAHYGDLLPPAEREGLDGGDCWPRLGDLPAAGLAVDLAGSVGRGALGMARRAAFTLGLDASFAAVRIAREVAASGRAPVPVVEEGSLARDLVADASSLRGGPVEFAVADPERPPLPPGIATTVLAALVLERQGEPGEFLRRAASLLGPGGTLAVASPFSWWEGGLPKAPGLGDGSGRSRDVLVSLLGDCGLRVEGEEDLRLVLREHARLAQVVRPLLVRARRGSGAPDRF
jgi:uncharacterized protein YbaR (Trm112 family)